MLDVEETPLETPIVDALGVELDMFDDVVPSDDDILASRSLTNPCDANGAGSIPLLVNLSESDAKHLNAPSATCKNVS